jgi:hypothetical protein
MATCSVSGLLESGKCLACLTEKELDVVIAQLLRQWAETSATASELMASGKCLACLTTQELGVIQAQLLCEING